MSDNEKLFIPIDVKTLIVNDRVRIEQNFQRWEMNFNSLKEYTSPEPPAFTGGDAAWRDKPEANGIYLHWSLPEALRHGVQESIDSTTEFPLVPNRWIVIRYSGKLEKRIATAWVVESDYLDPNEGTSSYIDPFSDNFKVTRVGRKVDIDSWSEENTKELYMTAVGTGDITFSAYQPYVENVFSIHDPLEGIEKKETLSYMVAGWYSDPSEDILAASKRDESFRKLLDSLNWQVTDWDKDPERTANISIYHGLVIGLAWNKEGPVPTSDRPTDPKSVSLAIGNTSIDAMTALIAQQAEAQGKQDEVDAELLEAFQYNLLPTLDEPNGKELLYQAIHKAWFGPIHGGYEYVVVKKPGKQIEPGENDSEPDWLATLNQHQANYDQAVHVLQDLQWKLYSLWWSKGKFDNRPSSQDFPSGFDDGHFENQLDPGQAGSLAERVKAQIKKVQELRDTIPNGATQEALQDSIKNYAADKNLPEAYELKQVNDEPYFLPNDPVVLLTGTKTSGTLTREEPLTCRFLDELVQGFTFNEKEITTSSLQATIPTVNLSQVPSGVSTLLHEFFFLDGNNAAWIANNVLETTDPETIEQVQAAMAEHDNVIGTLPDVNLESWQQPWLPLFLMWEIQYYPIQYDANAQANWEFDGMKYVWNGKGGGATPLSLSGRTFLTPNCSFNFKSRLDEFRQKHPDLDAEELKNLEDFISQTDDWDFLSQSMEGLTAQLALRSMEINRTPSGENELKNLIGNLNSRVPILGGLPPRRSKEWPESGFQEFRSGQFAFRRLTVVDRFGQTIEVISTQTSLRVQPIISPNMKPEKTVLAQEPYRFIELSPRLLQPGRLNFDYVSSTDDNKVINLHSDVNPVCGWILPNHLDRALSCYDNQGIPLGEARVITDSDGKRVVVWEGAPQGEYQTFDEVENEFPHLGEFLGGLAKQGADVYDVFFKVLDETLWTIDPLGGRDDANLSVWVGRPLVLTRARLQYQLDGAPIWDPSWQFTFKTKDPDFINYNFPISLGQLVLRNDGLIGYFLNNNYDQFNVVNPPQSKEFDYIKPIDPENFINLRIKDQEQQFVTMLLDPRASVHATTAFLPTTILNLPSRYVDPALASMKVTFSLGPYLSSLDIEEEENNKTKEESVFMPLPAEKSGKWALLTLLGEDWSQYALKPSDQRADLTTVDPVLRSGFLRLSNRK